MSSHVRDRVVTASGKRFPPSQFAPNRQFHALINVLLINRYQRLADDCSEIILAMDLKKNVHNSSIMERAALFIRVSPFMTLSAFFSCLAGSIVLITNGERFGSPRPRRSPGLCSLGGLHVRNGVYRQPAQTIQGKPHLREYRFIARPIWSEMPLVTSRANPKFKWDAPLLQTYIGSVLISVNPYKNLPIYGSDVVEQYRNVNFYEVPPHV